MHAGGGDRLDHRDAAAPQPVALARPQPDVAALALLGDPEAPGVAGDFDAARGFEAEETARIELHRAHPRSEQPCFATARAKAMMANPAMPRTSAAWRSDAVQSMVRSPVSM